MVLQFTSVLVILLSLSSKPPMEYEFQTSVFSFFLFLPLLFSSLPFLQLKKDAPLDD